MMEEKFDLEKDLEEQRKRLADTERRIKIAKEFQLTETLVESLQNLKDIRKDIADSQSERIESKRVSESIDSQLNEVLTLLRQYVADNKAAVDGINKYLADWK